MEKSAFEEIQIEKDVLGLPNSNFLVRSLYTFQSDRHIYFVMDFMPGGDLGRVLEAESRFEVDEARFHIAQIIKGLEFLHEYGIIHRDLKPENVLLDERGHCKLVDFGLSEP